MFLYIYRIIQHGGPGLWANMYEIHPFCHQLSLLRKWNFVLHLGMLYTQHRLFSTYILNKSENATPELFAIYIQNYANRECK